MFRKLTNKFLTALVVLLCAWTANAQTDGTYSGFSPYSVFGVGQMHQPGTAWNRSMGGVGVAARVEYDTKILVVGFLNPVYEVALMVRLTV